MTDTPAPHHGAQAGALHASIERAANVASVVTVANQYVTVNGVPQWIATVSTEELTAAAGRLDTAGRLHDNRAAVLLVVVAGVWLLSFAGARAGLHVTASSGAGAWLAIMVMAAIVPVGIWFAGYDFFRRHRLAMHIIEMRWAEIQAELAVRGAVKLDAVQRLRERMKRLAPSITRHQARDDHSERD